MSMSNILTVYRKELTDSLRDRRTLISMVVVPIVIFPLISVGMGTLVAKVVGKGAGRSPQGNDPERRRFAADRGRSEGRSRALRLCPPTPDYVQQISDKKIRAAVDVPSGFDAAVDHDDEGGLEDLRL